MIYKLQVTLADFFFLYDYIICRQIGSDNLYIICKVYLQNFFLFCIIIFFNPVRLYLLTFVTAALWSFIGDVNSIV